MPVFKIVRVLYALAVSTPSSRGIHVELETLTLKATVRVHLVTCFSAVCPISKTVDEYMIEIEYEGYGKYIELGSLRHYLDSFKGQEWFHEELCEKVANDLGKALGVPVKVKLKSNYLGITVEVEKSVQDSGEQSAKHL
jgi:NADPH-dependent 7-cyano-7-deazaguanine reductase QueF